jgi:hypothetical protein
MHSTPVTFLAISCALSAFACGGSGSDSLPTIQQTKQTLVFKGDCDASACASRPSNLETAASVTCASATDAACQWTDSDNSDSETSVGYRNCGASECSAKPNITCPTGTTLDGQECTSENDAPCSWTSKCVPPRDTTPCPQANGCDDQPMELIGIICTDGSTGALACVTNGKQCTWEPNCQTAPR